MVWIRRPLWLLMVVVRLVPAIGEEWRGHGGDWEVGNNSAQCDCSAGNDLCATGLRPAHGRMGT
jgi:hypothetical protein